MVVPFIASHAATVWWLVRVAQTRSISKGNKAADKDWDALVVYGKDVAAFTKTVYDLNGLTAKDFATFAKTVRHSMGMLARFPKSTQNFLEKKFHISDTLERESLLAYADYAARSANDESGTPLQRIGRIYRALYIVGRIDTPLGRNMADGVYIKLMTLHKKRLAYPRDAEVKLALEKLQSASVGQLLDALKHYPYLKRKKDLKPDYIAHALMPHSCGQLNHTGIAREIAALYGKD